ncbi:MAG TPA: DEAD/DEAH box helicase [Acidimicrobiales bacterium]|nr:DEAD/DEAH box helicase [Acidimicrobiales bacterium]
MNTHPIAGAPASFDDLGVPRALTSALARKGVTVPFPIQAATLPDSLAGRDVCGRAPTGGGKTLAFALAVLSRLSTRAQGRRRPAALVLAPTRELAAQIEAEIAPLAAAVGARSASFYGGVGYDKQLGALRRGVDVVIACPGRLADLVERGSVDLSSVDMVVIDEADRMADMGFLPAVRQLVDLTGRSRQTLLFSATLEGPVEALVRDYQHNPVRHDVEAAAAHRGDVQHHFWRVEPHDRVAVTADAIAARGPAIVFCRTKRGADRLSDRLAASGLQSQVIHGDRSQAQRDRALAAFRAGRLDVLVATDVASRGIHVDAVPLVVHFDPPADPTDYVHRAGRTGRSGEDGLVVSLVGREHMARTRLIQQKLGFPGGVSSPDLPSLATATAVRRPAAQPLSEAQPRSEAPVPGARAKAKEPNWRRNRPRARGTVKAPSTPRRAHRAGRARAI